MANILPELITILGPTASGKTRLAVAVAKEINAEIISADSRQVYKNMDIGTGKDLDEYGNVPHHLIDLCEAGEKYNLYQYQLDFTEAFQQVQSNGNTPILCGGSGLYIEAVLKGYDFTAVPIDLGFREVLAQKSVEELRELLRRQATIFAPLADFSSKKRLIRAIEIETFLQHNTFDFQVFKSIDTKIIGIDLPREERRHRIETRLHKRLQNGLIEEVEQLLAKGIAAETLIYYGLEYKFLTQYLQNQLSYAELVAQLTIAIQQFAKRQMTFFRKMERDGLIINWIDGTLPFERQVAMALEFAKV